MKRIFSVCIVVIFSLFAGVPCWAQEETSSPPTPPESPSTNTDAEEPPEPSQSDSESESGPDGEMSEADREAWKLLGKALDALAARDEPAAKRYLEKLHAQYPDHPASDVSADALDTLDGERPSAFLATPEAGQDGPGKKKRAEKKTGIARAELAIFQTINGLSAAGELCIIAECQDSRLIIGGLAAGAGAGLGLSLWATRNGITPGHALALNSGTFWGFTNGLFLDLALPEDGFDSKRLPTLMVGGQIAGLLAGQLAYNELQPTAGDVALMNTTGFWSGVIMLLINGVLEPQEIQPVGLSTLLAIDAGLVGGALLSKYAPMSRGRAFVIDAGGIVGTLTGVGAYLFFTDGVGEPRGGFTSAIVGAGAVRLMQLRHQGWTIGARREPRERVPLGCDAPPSPGPRCRSRTWNHARRGTAAPRRGQRLAPRQTRGVPSAHVAGTTELDHTRYIDS